VINGIRSVDINLTIREWWDSPEKWHVPFVTTNVLLLGNEIGSRRRLLNILAEDDDICDISGPHKT
jgi:hypothetical protein